MYTVRDDVRVLVVDDSDFFGTLVAGELSSQYDMEIETVTSAHDALDRIEDAQFDCVVSDYDMPEIDGIELFERLRDRGVEVPFFLLTAAGSEEIASQAITAGVADYFPKTKGEDQFEILGKRIQNVVAQRRAEQNLERQRRLHEDLWSVIQDLMHAPTQSDIDTTVCEELSGMGRFAFTWVSDGSTEMAPRAAAGIDEETLQGVREALRENDDRMPTAAALGDRTTRATTLDGPPVPGGEAVEIVAVPLLYRGGTYGVLGLATTADERLNEAEREALGRLGTTVGHALASVEIEREVQTFREAVEQADPAVIITDTDGTIEYVNRAFEEITGYDGEDVMGASFEEVVTGEWDADRWAAVRERVREGRPVREEIVQSRKNGAQFHADLSVAPITVTGSDVEKFVAIESDITELKSREQRLQVLNRVLRHNLRNDLNVVQGHLSLLRDNLDEGDARDHAEQAERKLEDLLSLSEKVRTVDKTIRAAREEESHRTVVLDDLLADEVEYVREACPDATITFDGTTDREIRSTRLDVAIQELLTNAIEHNDADDPHVTVSTTVEEAPEGFVAVEIEDDGPGIPDLEREVLERGQETELKHGRSLGLWLVNWIVTHEGGELTIEDAPDGGSIVRLSLPVAT